MIKLLDHQTANSAEFKGGCPGAWPREEVRVPDGTQLTPQEITRGFVLVTETEWAAIRASNQNAWDSWEASRKSQEDAALVTQRVEINAVVEDLRAIRDSTGALSAGQLSLAARANAKAMLWLLSKARDLFER